MEAHKGRCKEVGKRGQRVVDVVVGLGVENGLEGWDGQGLHVK